MSCVAGCSRHVHSMGALVRHGQHRARSLNAHLVVGAFGPPGSGKSEVMLRFLSECQGKPLNVLTQVAFRPKDVAPLAFRLPRFHAIQDDEATGKGGHKRASMTNDNVSSVQDFDAMRGRNQFVGLCAPRKGDLDEIKRGHLMWAFEITMSRKLTAYEAIRGSAMWQSEAYWEERFHIDRVPSIMDWVPGGPKLRDDYLTGKESHMRGGSTDAAFKSRLRLGHFESAVRQVLKELRD